MMPVPNRPPAASDPSDVLPIVGRRSGDIPTWLVAVLAIVGSILLFLVLDGQWRSTAVPVTEFGAADRVLILPPLPPLYLPTASDQDLTSLPPPPPPPPLQPSPAFGPAQAVALTPPPAMAAPLPPVANSQSPLVTATSGQTSPVLPSGGRGVIVFDEPTSSATAASATGLAAETESGASGQGVATEAGGRVRSSRLGQLANTVPQGALIPAVLETALDSTRPGFVRALVSRDVRGFDGSRVLIPRGSRLFGEYQADLAPGQNRAFIRWSRLVRPDGVAIDFDAPAADVLGRAGVQGRVNTHFFTRFTSALLQSTLSVGAALAGQSLGNDSVIVALPGFGQTLAAPAASQQVQPTLRVDAGATVTVFVAQDLIFSASRADR